MIRLAEKGLPGAIEGYGQGFLLNTDYRVWLRYPDILQESPESLFIREVPVITQEVVDALDLFYNEPAEIPRGSGSSEQLFDWETDGDYIYAAFMQAYGIDLVDTELHWHKFLALFSSLPEETHMTKIMSYRAYKGSDKEMKQLKSAWALPVKISEEEQQAMEEFNEIFG